jgi:small-conductance mechanosensitive channel
MFEPSVTAWQVAVAAGVLLLVACAAFVIDRVISARATRTPAAAGWDPTRDLATALRGLVFAGLILAGLRIALAIAPLRPRYAGIAADLLLVAFLVVATLLVSRVVVGLANVLAKRSGGTATTSSIIANVTRVSIFTVGALIALDSLGISVTPALAALGIGGLAVALALQDTLSNVFAGLHIIASKQVNRGDYVKLASGEEGYVSDIHWRYTTIRALQNNMVIVPNARLASTIVTNFHQPESEMAVLIDVGVSYDADLTAVESTTIEVARETLRNTAGGVSAFEPFIRFHTLDQYCIRFTVILRGREFTDQHLIKHEFIKRLLGRYQERGITIPYPTRTVLLDRNGRYSPASGEPSRADGRPALVREFAEG